MTKAPLDERVDPAVPDAYFEPPRPVDMIRFVQLPTDFERAPDTLFQSAQLAWQPLPGADTTAVPVLLGTLVAFLHRHTEQTTLALDYFASPGAAAIALDVPVEDGMSFGEVVQQVVPQVGADAHPDAGTRRANVAVTLLEGADITLGSGSFSYDYDAHFVIGRQQQNGLLTLVYNANLLTAASAGLLIESLAVMFEAASRNADQAVNRITLISPAQFQALTKGLDSGKSDYSMLPLCRHFSALAQQQPDACAARYHDTAVTYRELEERSNRLAHYLLERGVGPGVPVAVCVTPSPEILVAILAIWKARGIYLPLDPTHPQMLITRMVEEAKPILALTVSGLSRLTAGLAQFHFDADTAALHSCSAAAPATQPEIDDVAYVFYTSGTTGQPKGAMATQGNLLQYIHSARLRYGFVASDTFCSLARYTFSISLFELVLPLACGASLRLLDRDEVLNPERLYAALGEVTVVHAGPSLLGNLFRHIRGLTAERRTFPRMRHASSGGDIVTVAVMEEMKQVFPHAELFVIYGCTEISCMGTTFVIPRDRPVGRTFVGKPFPDVMLRVLDANGNLVPFGVIGEICFAGKGIVRGYLNRPELTSEKFIERDGQRFYQTGDVGCLHADGNLEIKGRRDFQVKLRGIRIELSGVESAVIRLGLATQCAVVARAAGNESTSLVAFAIKPAYRRIAAFRRALAAELPDYMLPQHLVELDAMPLTVNGKLDRNRLKEIPLEQALRDENLKEPANEHERAIAEVFARVLRRPAVGVDESFFDLGGHSLLGIILLDEIRKATGISIAPRVLYESGTVEALAACADSAAASQNRAVLLNRRVPGQPLFVLSGVQYFRKLAERLDGSCAVYGVFAPPAVGAAAEGIKDDSIAKMAREHLEIIRAQQPTGPYRLLGYSFGGLIAYEIVRLLRAAGEEVSLLVMLDTSLEEFQGWRYRLAQLARLPFAPPRDVWFFLYHRIRRRLGLNDGDVRPASDPGVTHPLNVRRDEINRHLSIGYVSGLEPYEGPALLVVSNVRLKAEPLNSRTAGWRGYIRQLEVVGVDAGHHSMITAEPHVSAVANILRDRLDWAASGGVRVR